MTAKRRLIRAWVHLSAMVLACVGLLLAAPTVAYANPEIVFTSVIAEQQPDGTVDITWTITGTDPGLTGFQVDRVDESSVHTPLPPFPVPLPTTARSTEDDLSGVSTGSHNFTYEVMALGTAATTTAFPSTIFKDVPSGPSAVDIHTNANVVTLIWQVPIVLPGSVTGYRIERRIGTVGPYTTIVVSQPTLSIIDAVPGLTTGIWEIDYIITSLSLLGDGGNLAPTANVYIGVPSFPETVTARMGFGGTAGVVDWTLPLENPGLVTGYRIARNIDGGGDVVLGTVGASVRQFVDPTLGPVAAGSSVGYTVTALSAAGDGGFQAGFVTVNHTQLAIGTLRLTPHNSSLGATWAAPDTGGVAVTSYRLRYRVRGTTAWTEVPASDIDSSARVAHIFGLVNGVHYEVQFAAVDVALAGQSVWSQSALAAPNGPILPPTGVGGAVRFAGAGSGLLAAGVLLLTMPVLFHSRARRRSPAVVVVDE